MTSIDVSNLSRFKANGCLYKVQHGSISSQLGSIQGYAAIDMAIFKLRPKNLRNLVGT